MNLNMFEGAASSTVRPRRQEGVSTQYTSGVRSVFVAKEERNIVNNQLSGGRSEDFSTSETDSDERQSCSSGSFVSQGIPLSAQALRFEIQTREAQLRTITDQGERGRIQLQLSAYRGLLRESEQGIATTEQVSAPIHDRTPRITPPKYSRTE